jgi:hypothetical protein
MKCRHAAAGRFQISQACLADSDSPEISVQWVEQVVGFSRDDRARHRKHGSATGVRGLCSNYFYDALYAYCQSLEGGHTP